MIVGYSGKYIGKLYEMLGTISEIERLDNDRCLITYNDIDTSEIKSGAPVYIKNLNNNSWIQIGVHYFYDIVRNKDIAIGITSTVLKWINENLIKNI